MASSGILCHVALVRIDVSEELSTSSSFLVFLYSMRRLLVTASVVPSSQIIVTLMKEAIISSEKTVLTRVTWCNIPEVTIFHSDRCENLKSYIIYKEFLCSLTGSKCCAVE
jgi:hypothetical protein